MSKLCLTQEEAQDTVKWYVKNELRYDSPNFRKSDDNKYYVIYFLSFSRYKKNNIPKNWTIMHMTIHPSEKGKPKNAGSILFPKE